MLDLTQPCTFVISASNIIIIRGFIGMEQLISGTGDVTEIMKLINFRLLRAAIESCCLIAVSFRHFTQVCLSIASYNVCY